MHGKNDDSICFPQANVIRITWELKIISAYLAVACDLPSSEEVKNKYIIKTTQVRECNFDKNEYPEELRTF